MEARPSSFLDFSADDFLNLIEGDGPITADPPQPAARREGLTHHLPAIARTGATGLHTLTDHAVELARQGVPADDILTLIHTLIHSRPPIQHQTGPGTSRPDIPVRRYTHRASMQAAMEAARPNNRKRALDDLEVGVLAASTRAPMESRRRTWQDLCTAWGVQAWPMTTFGPSPHPSRQANTSPPSSTLTRPSGTNSTC